MKKFIAICLTVIGLFVSIAPSSSINADYTGTDLSHINELTENAIRDGIFPGASILVKKGDIVLYNSSFGDAQLYDMGVKYDPVIKTTNDTVYDLASVTKVMATTQALMMLNYQGIIDLDEPVATYMPDFAQNGKEKVTSRDLLTHTSGLTPWKATFLYNNTRAQERDYVNKLPLEYNTGEKMKYSDFSFMALSFLVEEVVGMGIEDYLQQELYGPLGMVDTTYVPLLNGISKNRIAATSWGNPYEKAMSNEADYPGFGYDTTEDAEAFLKFKGWRDYTLIGEVNDGNAGMANEGVAGHAGLFSTTKDLSILGDVLLNGGTLNGKTFYDQAVIDEFTKPYADRFNRGLGWQVNGASSTSGYVGKYASNSVFSHAGFTGTQVIFDSQYDLQVIILTNKQNMGVNAKGSYASPYKYSREVMNLVYEEIMKNIENVSTDAVTNLLDEISALDSDHYSVNSFDNLMILKADTEKKLLNELLIREEINSLLEILSFAKDKLIYIKDLQDLVNSTHSLVKDIYETGSWNTLENALKNAETLLKEHFITKDSLDTITKDLTDALDNLKVLESKPITVDKTKLEALLNDAKKLDSKKYTTDSWLTLTNVLKKVELSLVDKEVTQDSIDQLYFELNNALTGLRTNEILPPTGVSSNNIFPYAIVLFGVSILFISNFKSKKKENYQ